MKVYIKPSKVLLKEEVQTVLKQYPGDNIRMITNRVIFRLSCCCGLRRKEICGLNLGDVTLGGSRPEIEIRKDNTKGQLEYRKARTVPLWWDKGTLRDVSLYYELRKDQGAAKSDPLVVKTRRDHAGGRMTEPRIARRWSTAIKVLGEDRVSQLTIHTGRHTFCSHAIAAGRSLVAVQHAAGHSTIQMTEAYLHLIDDGSLPDVFAEEGS